MHEPISGGTPEARGRDASHAPMRDGPLPPLDSLFADLAAPVDDAVAVWDLHGYILSWNRGAEKLYGYTPDEAVGRHMSMIMPEHRKGEPRRLVEEMLADRMPGQYESERLTQHGAILPVTVSPSPLRDRDGAVVGVCTVAFDTRRRRLEESTFRALLDAAPDAIVIVCDDGRIVLVNQQTELLFGYDREELLGQPIEILVPEQNRGRHRGYRTSYFTSPIPRPMGAGVSLSARRKDGAQFPVEISLSPLATPDGLLVSAAIRDVTARRRAEEKVRALLESAPDAMVIVGSDGRIVLVNRQAELLFGYERDDLLGQPVEVLVPHRFRRRHGDHRASYFHSPTVRPMGAGLQLYGLRRDDTQFPVEISLSPIETEEGMFVSAAIRDVTDRKVAEERLQFALERERQAMEHQRELDRLKDEFLSIVSHELRTPLSLILGFSEMLTRKKHLIDADKRGQLLDRIWSNASAMNRMVEQLLDYSRLEAGKVSIQPEREDLRSLVEGCVGRLRDLLRAHTLSIDVDPALTAEVDAQAFERILANLLTNAAKFTPEGGAIKVGAETHEGEVVVQVEDSGIGIPVEEQGRLFERFYQGAAAGGATRGTGIGLSIVKRYVEMHGGRVWVKSQPGVGSSFFFTLPFVRTRVPER